MSAVIRKQTDNSSQSTNMFSRRIYRRPLVGPPFTAKRTRSIATASVPDITRWAVVTGDNSKLRPTQSATSLGEPVRIKRIVVETQFMRKSPAPVELMPLDVLFEIFKSLSPSDLLMLLRTSKAFRTILMDKKAESIWKVARSKAFPVPPECPREMTELQYADLLWGKACQSCGVKGASRGVKTVWEFCRRFCARCFRMSLVSSAGFVNLFPRYDKAILDVLPHVKRPLDKKGYLTTAVEKMGKELHTLQDSVSRGCNSHKDVKDWLLEKGKTLEEVNQHAELCNHWSRDYAQERIRKLNLTFREKWTNQLVRMGYSEQDSIRVLRLDKYDNHYFTRWYKRIDDPHEGPKAMLRDLQRDLKIARVAREIGMARAIREDRRAVMQAVYVFYLKRIDPVDVQLIPHQAAILHLEDYPAFSQVLNAPHSVNVDWAHFAPGYQYFPVAIQRWQGTLDDRRAQLENKIDPLGISSAARSQLASAVFTCVQCPVSERGCARPLIGYEDTVLHRHGLQDLVFNPYGSTCAAALAKLVGLDPDTATPLDLDKVDARFVCMTCNLRRQENGSHARRALNWRQCVTHVIEKGHKKSPFKLLSPRETAGVKSRESADPQDSQMMWACAHCYMASVPSVDGSAGPMRMKRPLFEHIANVHGITSPVERKDFFRDLTKAEARTQRVPVLCPI